MDEMLKKIDEIKERMGVSYKEAKEALEKNGNSVVDAIIYLERSAYGKKAVEKGKNILCEVQGIVEKGKETKIQVLKEGKPIAEIPAAVGIFGLIGTLAIPGGAVVGALGSVAALMNKYSLEIKGRPIEDEEKEQNDVDN